MARIFFKMLLGILLLFILPVLAHLGVWAATDRPDNWHTADWTSSGVLPEVQSSPDAAIYIMAARTGGLKGAVSVHSWIVVKTRNASEYTRYDVVGWGRPVRINAFEADGRWYSNYPRIVFSLTGIEAAKTLPKLEAAIQHYQWSSRGDYSIWPGPNSNTFVATIIRAVPELDTSLPATAIGKDYLVGSRWFLYDPKRKSLQISIAGYAGFTIGGNEGFEINLFGLVAGISLKRPGIKLPGFGLIGW